MPAQGGAVSQGLNGGCATCNTGGGSTEATPTPGRTGLVSAAPIAGPPKTWSTGLKKILAIRLDFPDLIDIRTSDAGQKMMDGVLRQKYHDSSYGKTDLQSTVTPVVYRLPHDAGYYATSNSIWTLIQNDATPLAAANYDLAAYDRIAFSFPSLKAVPGSTVRAMSHAQYGGKYMWLNGGGFGFYTVAHELGHTYGLRHANRWKVPDGNPVNSKGRSEEYADNFDIMGDTGDPTLRDFNPWFKSLLGWMDGHVQTVTVNGTYRVNRFDNTPAATGILALKIRKNNALDYWISYRGSFAENPAIKDGAYIVWGHDGITETSELIDMVPATNYSDAMLPVGQTLTDSSARLRITPIAKGGIAPNEFLDVTLEFY
ncbi:MAG: hypothetical protein H0W43_03325 [Chthoniobacterales bacterium]|nr:hypothetical protein [Chthoniobacterales bacterium]